MSGMFSFMCTTRQKVTLAAWEWGCLSDRNRAWWSTLQTVCSWKNKKERCTSWTRITPEPCSALTQTRQGCLTSPWLSTKQLPSRQIELHADFNFRLELDPFALSPACCAFFLFSQPEATPHTIFLSGPPEVTLITAGSQWAHQHLWAFLPFLLSHIWIRSLFDFNVTQNIRFLPRFFLPRFLLPISSDAGASCSQPFVFSASSKPRAECKQGGLVTGYEVKHESRGWNVCKEEDGRHSDDLLRASAMSLTFVSDDSRT